MYGLLFVLQHWEKVVTNGPENPSGRYGHAVTIIPSPLMGDQLTLLLVAGGCAYFETLNHSWLLSVGDGALWREVSVVNRNFYAHSTCDHHHLYNRPSLSGSGDCNVWTV